MHLLVQQTKDLLRREILGALDRARANGVLPPFSPPEVEISAPKERSHGDLATSVALVAAKAAKRPPREVAQAIVAEFRIAPPIEGVELAGPGFINFFLTQAWREEALAAAIAEAADYGRSATLAGQRIQIEFVSANPVGPLNVVNARAGALGDSLARLMRFAGAEVEREYYVNDHGVQVWQLGRSVEARYRQLLGEEIAFPEEGYQGGYVYDLAKAFLAQAPAGFRERPEEERIEACREFALRGILAEQQAEIGRASCRVRV